MFVYEVLLNGKVMHTFTAAKYATDKAEKLAYALWYTYGTKADIRIRIIPTK